MVEGHPRNISEQSDLKSSKRFLTRRFSKFPIYTYKGKCHAPWRPCFLTDQNSFKESGRGPPKEHFCIIRFEIQQVVFDKKIFKELKKNCPFLALKIIFEWISILSRNLVDIDPRNMPAKFRQIWSRGYVGDVV